MKALKFILAISFGLLTQLGFSQLQNLFIEKYYISDTDDATDTTGGILPEGSTTYRIYAKLLPGSAVSKIFGDANHAFTISSSAPFFNHATEGKSFGKDFLKPRLGESLVALDTYLTIGQVAKQGPNTYFGLPKNQDTNGSFIGGSNSDGGSEMLPQGLMNNQNNEMGLALTQVDGIDTMVTAAATWSNFLTSDYLTFGIDSTIFGSVVPGYSYESNQFYLTPSVPYSGVVADSNHVMLAQLTTAGEISFNINLEVVFFDNEGNLQSIEYVAQDTLIGENQQYNPFLSYPYACGCNDPSYLEYSPAFICFEEGSCLNKAIIGCSDSLACNYDPKANIMMEELCCYPGDCNNRNITEVCPALLVSTFECGLYPNPAEDQVRINVVQPENGNITIQWFNAFGTMISTENVNDIGINYNNTMDISHLMPGVYYIQITAPLGTQILTLFKI